MIYGLIGERLGHSFSKAIHSKLYDTPYILTEVSRQNFADFMKARDFKAINVTIPYKQDVIPYLDGIDSTAEEIGAVNTIVNENGKLYGFNTDFSGLKALILKNSIDLKGKKVLILGSGGTSKTAFSVANELGADQVYRLSRKGGEGLLTYAEAEEKHSDAQVIINTTPCGMYPNLGDTAVDIDKFPDLQAVVDAIYNPLNTALVLKARRRGIKATGGLYMLVAQGVFAAEKFLGEKIPTEKADEIYKTLLKEKQNLVLVGMPSSGKTTLGKELSRALSKAFVDTDSVIEQREGMPIPEIFKIKGEKEFRRIESEVIKELSARQGLVIATGGGAVLNDCNVRCLKANGAVVFIDRDLEKLIATSDRPLSSNKADLQKRYKERYGIYCQSADYIFKADSDVKTEAAAIKEVFLSENFSD